MLKLTKAKLQVRGELVGKKIDVKASQKQITGKTISVYNVEILQSNYDEDLLKNMKN